MSRSSKVKIKISKPIKIEKPKKEKKIMPECSFQSEKKCRSKVCDVCLFCNNNYCNSHLFDHVVSKHKTHAQCEVWVKEYKKNEYNEKLAKLQEKYSEFISDE